ncbi:MAG: S41 family peptidase [Clostridia bacterium]|nr:S41 family peptidase [Clostridia bacterium]
MDSEKKQNVYKSIMLVVVSVIITFIITTLFMYQKNENNDNTKYVIAPSGESSIGSYITSIRKVIDKYYLGEIDETKLKDGAITGYVDALGDEYSEYITKEDYETFSTSIMGNYVGIGIYMSVYKDTDEIVVVAPIKGSPAEKSGLLSGDIIVKVDGTPYAGADELEIAAAKIKGEAGTTVDLEIKRNEDIMNFTITREKVVMNPVTSEVLDGNIGYIQVTSFDEDCSIDFLEKYKELEEKNIKALIIDIRNNGGGIVQEALDIADYIVPKGKTLMITVNKTEKEETVYSKENPTIKVPVVMLVNENSASASEILAGALMDNECAKIVGAKTYGKGVIQEVLKLLDGSALKLTTEEYFTPNRSKINKVGIEPNEVVELPEGVKTSYNIDRDKDTQLKKAIEILK